MPTLSNRAPIGLPLTGAVQEEVSFDLKQEMIDNGGARDVHTGHTQHVPKLLLPRAEVSRICSPVAWKFGNDFGDSPRDLLFDKLDGSQVDVNFLSNPHASNMEAQGVAFGEEASTVNFDTKVSNETRNDGKKGRRRRRRAAATVTADAIADAHPAAEAMSQRGNHQGNGARSDPALANDVSASAPAEAECPVEWPDNATTVMLRNIPNRYIAEELLAEIMEEGFDGQLDLFYLPIDFATKRNRGYAFINFHTTDIMHKFVGIFEDRRLTRYATKKVLHVTPAATQGFEANVQAFVRKDAQRIMNPWFRPMIFGRSSDAGEIAGGRSDCSQS